MILAQPEAKKPEAKKPEAKKGYTPAEYLSFETTSATRHEYRNGQIVPMTGGTPNHNDIGGNLYILLKAALKGKNYQVFYADQRLWVPEANLYTYPDVMVLPMPLDLQPGHKNSEFLLCRRYANGVRNSEFGIRNFSFGDATRTEFGRGELGVGSFSLTLNSLGIVIALADLYDTMEFEAVDPTLPHSLQEIGRAT